MVVIQEATYINRCIFSKKIIKSHNRICLFNKQQYEAFKNIIYEIFNSHLPTEIIDLIIELTKYKNYIGRFGHEKVANWTINNKSQELNRWKNKKIYNEHDIIDSSDSDYNSD